MQSKHLDEGMFFLGELSRNTPDEFNYMLIDITNKLRYSFNKIDLNLGIKRLLKEAPDDNEYAVGINPSVSIDNRQYPAGISVLHAHYEMGGEKMFESLSHLINLLKYYDNVLYPSIFLKSSKETFDMFWYLEEFWNRTDAHYMDTVIRNLNKKCKENETVGAICPLKFDQDLWSEIPLPGTIHQSGSNKFRVKLYDHVFDTEDYYFRLYKQRLDQPVIRHSITSFFEHIGYKYQPSIEEDTSIRMIWAPSLDEFSYK